MANFYCIYGAADKDRMARNIFICLLCNDDYNYYNSNIVIHW